MVGEQSSSSFGRFLWIFVRVGGLQYRSGSQSCEAVAARRFVDRLLVCCPL
jgi:hypothetical protein